MLQRSATCSRVEGMFIECLRQTKDGTLIALHVVPGAKKTEIAGFHGDRLKLRVAAPPIDGAANEEVEIFLSRVLNSKAKIFRGEKSRKKDVLVRGLDVESVSTLLRALTDGK